MASVFSLLASSLRGPFIVLLLFASACFFCFFRKKAPPGIVFFTFASVLCLLGVVPSKWLFYSFCNTVTISLLCLYFVMLVALQSGVIGDILDVIFRFSKGRSIKFYLLLTAFASFFPSRRMEREILGFLKKRNAETKGSTHVLFPVLFVLASSLTMLGSATNMVSDYISSKILHGTHWGFFTYGPLSLSLFIVSFVFFFSLIHLQARKGLLVRFAAGGPAPNLNEMTFETTQRSSAMPSSDIAFQVNSNAIDKPIKQPQTVKMKKALVLSVLLLLILLSLCGLHLICVSPLCAFLLFFVKGSSPRATLKRLPWDLLLLVVSAFLFCHGFVLTGSFNLTTNLLKHLHGNISAMTFFLFTAGLLSLAMPSIMVVAFMLPIFLGASTFSPSPVSQHLLNIITIGSFFLFPRRSLVYFDKTRDQSEEKLTLLKIQGVWILVIYLVLYLHTLYL